MGSRNSQRARRHPAQIWYQEGHVAALLLLLCCAYAANSADGAYQHSLQPAQQGAQASLQLHLRSQPRQ